MLSLSSFIMWDLMLKHWIYEKVMIDQRFSSHALNLQGKLILRITFPTSDQLHYDFVNTENEMLHFWGNYHHWLQWKLSIWKLLVQAMMKILSKWHISFSVCCNSNIRLLPGYIVIQVHIILTTVNISKIICWHVISKVLSWYVALLTRALLAIVKKQICVSMCCKQGIVMTSQHLALLTGVVQQCHHFLSFWQLLGQPVIKVSSTWWHFCFILMPCNAHCTSTFFLTRYILAWLLNTFKLEQFQLLVSHNSEQLIVQFF